MGSGLGFGRGWGWVGVGSGRVGVGVRVRVRARWGRGGSSASDIRSAMLCCRRIIGGADVLRVVSNVAEIHSQSALAAASASLASCSGLRAFCTSASSSIERNVAGFDVTLTTRKGQGRGGNRTSQKQGGARQPTSQTQGGARQRARQKQGGARQPNRPKKHRAAKRAAEEARRGPPHPDELRARVGLSACQAWAAAPFERDAALIREARRRERELAHPLVGPPQLLRVEARDGRRQQRLVVDRVRVDVRRAPCHAGVRSRRRGTGCW